MRSVYPPSRACFCLYGCIRSSLAQKDSRRERFTGCTGLLPHAKRVRCFMKNKRVSLLRFSDFARSFNRVDRVGSVPLSSKKKGKEKS